MLSGDLIALFPDDSVTAYNGGKVYFSHFVINFACNFRFIRFCIRLLIIRLGFFLIGVLFTLNVGVLLLSLVYRL